MNPRESLVLCEGYHDRAFWAGWLLHLGCTDPGAAAAGGVRGRVPDPWGKPVVRGEYGFHSTSGEFLRVRPCGGKAAVLRELQTRLAEESQRARQDSARIHLRRVVLSTDPDTLEDGSSSKTSVRQQDLIPLARRFDENAQQEESGELLLFEGSVCISLVRWEATDGSCAGVPRQQTLERLVCAALVAAYPQRGSAVQAWLDSRPAGPPAGPKEFAWSHMAGWYADHGCENFFRYLWAVHAGDGHVRQELEKRLRACGAWRIAETLAE